VSRRRIRANDDIEPCKRGRNLIVRYGVGPVDEVTQVEPPLELFQLRLRWAGADQGDSDVKAFLDQRCASLEQQIDALAGDEATGEPNLKHRLRIAGARLP